MKYYDKHDNLITAGVKLKHEDGEIQEVYACGEDDLGFNASNPDFLALHPSAVPQFYPLFQFDMSEWEIVEADD